MTTTSIVVSDYVLDELDRIMQKEQHLNHDSVIRTLLGNYDPDT